MKMGKKQERCSKRKRRACLLEKCANMTKKRKQSLEQCSENKTIESSSNFNNQEMSASFLEGNQDNTLPIYAELQNVLPAIKGIHKVPSLAVLCGKVIKKYKLLPEPKKFAPPESFSVVGGKPLRKRSERLLPEKILEEKRKKKSRNPPSLAALCQIVVKEHNLLPECEETIRPSTSTTSIDKNISSKRGRPRKETKIEDPTKRRKGRPRKDAVATAASEDSTTSTVTYVNYTTFLRQSQITRKIKVEEELNLPLEEDPLRQDDEDYIVVVKEENVDDEDTSTYEAPVTVQEPQGTSKGIIINPLASTEIPGSSREGLKPAAHFMTVVMDEYQVFANSIAHQLRALPPNRALLLQLDIQSMIDNEKQLLMHETCD